MGTIRVILVDDRPSMRAGVRAVLEDLDDIAIVSEAGSGHEAIGVVCEVEADVVVMDVAMPGMTGIEATRRLREAGTASKILALSMHDENSYVEGMLEAGACGYVLKDRAAEDLAHAIRTVHAGGRFTSPGIRDADARADR